MQAPFEQLFAPQSVQALPLAPQTAAVTPASQLPAEVQHPAQLSGLQSAVAQACRPKTEPHSLPAQFIHVRPPQPQAVAESPASHLSFSSQHPVLQVSAVQNGFAQQLEINSARTKSVRIASPVKCPRA